MIARISKVIKAVLIFFVKLYQWILSPFLPNACRHIPSCSQYTKEALEIHGPLRGSFMSFKRIMRCHPWGSYGYDPVEK